MDFSQFTQQVVDLYEEMGQPVPEADNPLKALKVKRSTYPNIKNFDDFKSNFEETSEGETYPTRIGDVIGRKAVLKQFENANRMNSPQQAARARAYQSPMPERFTPEELSDVDALMDYYGDSKAHRDLRFSHGELIKKFNDAKTPIVDMDDKVRINSAKYALDYFKDNIQRFQDYLQISNPSESYNAERFDGAKQAIYSAKLKALDELDELTPEQQDLYDRIKPQVDEFDKKVDSRIEGFKTRFNDLMKPNRFNQGDYTELEDFFEDLGIESEDQIPLLKKFLETGDLKDLDLSELRELPYFFDNGDDEADRSLDQIKDLVMSYGNDPQETLAALLGEKGIMQLMKDSEFGQQVLDVFGRDNVKKAYSSQDAINDAPFGLPQFENKRTHDYGDGLSYNYVRDLPSSMETIAKLHNNDWSSAKKALKKYEDSLNDTSEITSAPDVDLTDKGRGYVQYSFSNSKDGRGESSSGDVNSVYALVQATNNKLVEVPEHFQEAGITNENFGNHISEIEWKTTHKSIDQSHYDNYEKKHGHEPEDPYKFEETIRALDALYTWKQIAPTIPVGTILTNDPAVSQKNRDPRIRRKIYEKMGFHGGETGIVGKDGKVYPLDYNDFNYNEPWTH